MNLLSNRRAVLIAQIEHQRSALLKEASQLKEEVQAYSHQAQSYALFALGAAGIGLTLWLALRKRKPM